MRRCPLHVVSCLLQTARLRSVVLSVCKLSATASALGERPPQLTPRRPLNCSFATVRCKPQSHSGGQVRIQRLYLARLHVARCGMSHVACGAPRTPDVCHRCKGLQSLCEPRRGRGPDYHLPQRAACDSVGVAESIVSATDRQTERQCPSPCACARAAQHGLASHATVTLSMCVRSLREVSAFVQPTDAPWSARLHQPVPRIPPTAP